MLASKDLYIVGGMGLQAGMKFQDVVDRVFAGRKTSYRFDRSYPDRVAWLEGHGHSPAPLLADAMSDAFALGAKYVVMACNTAHLALGEVKAKLPRWLSDRVIDMVGETLKVVANDDAVWFGTTVLANSGLLEGVDVPNKDDQDVIQAAIWAAKNDEFPYNSEIKAIAEKYDSVVAGCTEMPLILEAAGINEYVDPAVVVAELVLAI